MPRGKVKEWEDGPYASYDWVTCHRCNGITRVGPARINAERAAKYERDLATWRVAYARHKILRTIKLTAEQIEVLRIMGLTYYQENYT